MKSSDISETAPEQAAAGSVQGASGSSSGTLEAPESPGADTGGAPIAAFWQRLFAALFDLLLLLVIIVLFVALRGGLLLHDFTAPVENPASAPVYQALKRELVLCFLGASVLFVSYFVALETWFARGTLGKIIFNIRIASEDAAADPGLRRIALRFLAKFGIGALTLGMSWLAALFSPKRQAWHDRIAKTVVVVSSE